MTEQIENLLYSWKFSETKNRSPFWYIIALSLIIGLVFWGIYTGQYGLSIVAILTPGVIFFIENNSLEEVSVEVSTLGIKIGEEFFEFSKINNYNFIYEKANAVFLRLTLNKRTIKHLNLRVDNKICEDLKQILPNFLAEGENSELSFTEKIINLLKL